ncbi:glycosyltransferase [Microlunatus soli]|uniref:Glycosyltransferase involved in cell wall bisynthesis n=1 Tax=Microlunatus soli TaxID=630515 RepID=A0A1H1NX84_9ACTN|nr:glycosyltransferase [Microlunatus soli]SDS03557.1 Glycosyltransferase involved in cell wall bisynthesis [Microlunatus soli]
MLPDRMDPRQQPARIGYLMKMFPRFSETFIVTEILALEAQGREVEIFSLRTPTDGRFHPDLARITAPVQYLQPGTVKAEQLWTALAGYRDAVGPLDDDQLRELLRVPPREAAQALDLARAVRSRRITHLHAHFGSVATTVARLAARLSGIGYSFTAHAKDIFHTEVDEADLGQKIAEAQAVITVSDYNLQDLTRRFSPAAGRVRRIYNGIDLQRFRYAAADDGRRPAGPVRIAAVGRLVEKKGFDDLIAAAALLDRRGVDFRLEIAGTGPLSEPLAAMIMGEGLADRVRLLGALPQNEVRRLVSSAAVFAAPCKVGADGNRDGLPTVLLEAMALGTTCVSTPVTGIPEVVDHRRTGLLVPESDPEALAEALTELITDPALAAALADAARARIEADFDAERQASRIAALFDSLHQPAEVTAG